MSPSRGRRFIETALNKATFGLFRTFRHQAAPVPPEKLQNLLRFRTSNRDALSDVYNRMLEIVFERNRLYRDYEEIMEDSAVASALELMVDDALPFNADRGKSVWVESDNDALDADLNTRLEELGIEFNAADWGFMTALYGDFMVGLDTQEGKGIMAIDDSIHPIDVDRVDINGKLIAFRDKTEKEENQYKDPFSFVHFRMLGAYRRRRSAEFGVQTRRISEGGGRFRLTTKYGISVIANARRPWIQLSMSENAMILNRMSRHPRVIYQLKMADPSPELAVQYVDMYEEKLFKNRSIAPNENRLVSLPQDLAYGDDIVLPESEAASFSINEINAKDLNVTKIADIEYLKNKFYGSLKVPQAFLGFESALPGGLGDNSLFYISIRYSRTVKRLQRAICDGIKKLLIIDYLLRNPNASLSPKDFRVVTDIASTAEELERRKGINLMADTVQKMVSTADLLQVRHTLKAEKIMAWAMERALPGMDRREFFDENAKRPPVDPLNPGATGNPNDMVPDPAKPKKIDPGKDLDKDMSKQQKNVDSAQRKIAASKREMYDPPLDPDLYVLIKERQRRVALMEKGEDPDAEPRRIVEQIRVAEKDQEREGAEG